MDASTQGGEVSYDSFFTGHMGLFGGIEYFVPNMNGMRLKLEYSGIDYSREGFPTIDSFSFAFEDVRKPQSKLNFSIEYPVNEYFKIDASFVKGNTLNFGMTVALPLAKKNALVKRKIDQPKEVSNPLERKLVAAKSDENLYNLARKHLNNRELYLQAANREGAKLEIIYAQNTFPSFAMSAGRVVRVLDDISPEFITDFKISNINGGMGMHSIEINRELFNKYNLTSYTQLPLITKDDPVCKYHGGKRNDIFKIINNSETSGIYISYRLVQ